MSICIGINLGEFVLLVADTRTIFGRPAISHTDESIKVYEYTQGIISGTGWSDLLNPVIDRMQNESYDYSSMFRGIVEEEVDRVCALDWGATREDLQSSIGMTGWMYSYATIQKDKTILRLALYHDSLSLDLEDDYLYLVYDGSGIVFTPDELGENASTVYGEYLNEKLQEIAGLSQGDEKILRAIELCSSLVGHCSQVSHSVSDEYLVGLHLLSGDRVVIGPYSADTTSSLELCL